MKYLNTFARLAAGALVVLLVSGCAINNVANIKKDASYKEALAETSLGFRYEANLPHKISVISKVKQQVSERFIKLANAGTDAYLKRLTMEALPAVADALKAKGVKVVNDDGKSGTRLMIRTTSAESEFYIDKGYNYRSVWLHVSLHDNKLDKDVWEGDFKVYFGPGKATNASRFAGELVGQLHKSALL